VQRLFKLRASRHWCNCVEQTFSLHVIWFALPEPCQCKEEVEREEAQALAAAMERSSVNEDCLPHIPGLSRQITEKTVTIHVQDEVTGDNHLSELSAL